mmetsp:Transcript_25829/g.53716  ORF Transcript_25829/g.53716 Transcript_25829/m.53716 type:complete len:240 (-) Transcript_25829:343-1062(-)
MSGVKPSRLGAFTTAPSSSSVCRTVLPPLHSTRFSCSRISLIATCRASSSRSWNRRHRRSRKSLARFFFFCSSRIPTIPGVSVRISISRTSVQNPRSCSYTTPFSRSSIEAHTSCGKSFFSTLRRSSAVCHRPSYAHMTLSFSSRSSVMTPRIAGSASLPVSFFSARARGRGLPKRGKRTRSSRFPSILMHEVGPSWSRRYLSAVSLKELLGSLFSLAKRTTSASKSATMRVSSLRFLL